VTEAPKTPAERFELRSAAPRQRGPLESSGAAPADKSETPDVTPQVGKMPQAGAMPTEKATADKPAEDGPGPAPKAASAPDASAPDASAPDASAADSSAADKDSAKDSAKDSGKNSVEDSGKAEKSDKPEKAAGASSDAAKKDEAGKPGADPKPAGDLDKTKVDTKTDTKVDTKTDDKTDDNGGTKAAVTSGAKADGGSDGKPEPVKTARTRRFRPLHAVGRAGRATGRWAKGPNGRVVIPGVVIVGLVIFAGTSGAYLVPKALEAAPAPSATPTFGDGAAGAASGAPGGVVDPAAGLTGLPGGGLPTDGFPPAGSTGFPGAGTGLPGGTTGLPGGTTGLPGLPATGLPTGLPTQPATTGGRPADALSSWATQVGTQIGIPVIAVQAYGYAELVTAKTTPSCHLSWTTLAALAKVESEHGSHNGAVLGVDGVATPTIYGLPLDGKGGRMLINDTDRGVLDGDTTFDRAIGPMQFIPSTWNENAVDADNDSVKNPNDIDDAALTAAVYLCKGGRDLAKAESWWDAILTYNAVRPYAQKVFQFADDYGRRSRS
jgi:hypothetical protein